MQQKSSGSRRLARAEAVAALAARVAAREGGQARARTLRITPRGQVAVRSGFERCDPAERLEEPVRVRGSRADRTRRVKMFARGDSLSTSKRRLTVLELCAVDSSAVNVWGEQAGTTDT